jgi:hypothetical protein
MKVVALVVSVLLATAGTTAHAQIGVPNTPALPPGQPLPAPFGTAPHPFNDSHPAQPWDRFHVGTVGLPIGDFEVPARSVVIPIEVVHPGSLPSTAEPREVTLPGYRVTETTTGFIVHEHWGVRPVGNIYQWTLIPTYFRAKQ